MTLMSKSNSKHIVFGPVMIPDKEIYRRTNNTIDEPHYVFFSKETIEKIRNDFHKSKLDNHVNINHDGILVEEVKLTKSFLINELNRSKLDAQFQDLPNGTWMAEYQIEHEEIWKLVVNEQIRGFSIEGMFDYYKEK